MQVRSFVPDDDDKMFTIYDMHAFHMKNIDDDRCRCRQVEMRQEKHATSRSAEDTMMALAGSEQA